MKRVLVVILVSLLSVGCKRGKAAVSGPIGEISVAAAEVTEGGKRWVRVTTTARPDVLVRVKNNREGIQEHTDSCYTKAATSCSVDIPADKFSRYASELMEPVKKPFKFSVEVTAEGAESVKKDQTWSPGTRCVANGSNLSCEGLSEPAGVLRVDEALAIEISPWTEELTVNSGSKTVKAPPGKSSWLPLDASLVTLDLMRKYLANRTARTEIQVPLKITGPKGTVYDGPLSISVGGLFTSMGRILDSPLPWAKGTNKTMLVFSKAGSVAQGNAQGSLTDVLGEPATLLEVGLLGYGVGSDNDQRVPCGAYTKAGSAGTSQMMGLIEGATLVVQEAKTAKVKKRTLLRATGNPCHESNRVKKDARYIGVVSLSPTAVTSFFKGELGR